MEARTRETGKLALLDLSELLRLWIANYARLDEPAKVLLPLRPVYYLAPVPRTEL